MNKKIKKLVDVVMYILLILCIGYQVTGLYIAGTYYLLEIVERKKDDRKRKNENA